MRIQDDFNWDLKFLGRVLFDQITVIFLRIRTDRPGPDQTLYSKIYQIYAKFPMKLKFCVKESSTEIPNPCWIRPAVLKKSNSPF